MHVRYRSTHSTPHASATYHVSRVDVERSQEAFVAKGFRQLVLQREGLVEVDEEAPERGTEAEVQLSSQLKPTLKKCHKQKRKVEDSGLSRSS